MTKSKSVVSRGQSCGEGLLRGTKEPCGVMEMFVVFIVVIVSQMCSYVKTDFMVHFKYVVDCMSIIPQKTVSKLLHSG